MVCSVPRSGIGVVIARVSESSTCEAVRDARGEALSATGGARRAARRAGGGAGQWRGGRRARPAANPRGAARGVPRPCCRGDALMLFLPTRGSEKAPRGFKLLYVDKTLL